MQLSKDAINNLLKGTSRAFYLSIRVLPPKARWPLSLAYLLARAADTVADSPATNEPQRLKQLQELKNAVNTPGKSWHLTSSLQPDKPEEQLLLEATPELLQILDQEEAQVSQAIRSVVSTLIEGMLWDHQLFSSQTLANKPLTDGLTQAELERYTYLVAGCVGPFWSKICALSDPSLNHLTQHDELAIEFGKGLQWVNILRDIPKDQENGRYYLPSLSQANFLKVFCTNCRRALFALQNAIDYPLLFPSHHLRHRLAVLLPLAIGLRTLEKLFRAGGPRSGCRIKISRPEVLLWLLSSPILVSNNAVLKFTLNKLQSRTGLALTELEVLV